MQLLSGDARPQAPAQKTSRAGLLAGAWWHGGVLEGSVAAAMIAGTSALLGLPVSGPLLVLAFCGTLGVYQLDRAPALSPEDRFNHPARVRWYRRHRLGARVLTAGAVLGALPALALLRGRTLLAGAALGAAGLAYALPLLARGRRFKDIGVGKPFAVAAAWALGSAVLPALEAGAPLASHGAALAALAGYRFLFALPNLLLADLADRHGDARSGLHTAATAWPVPRLRRLAAGVLALALAGGGAALAVSAAPRLLAVDLLGLALLLVVIASGASDARRRRAADLVMLWPAVTAAVAALM